jgi:hypothetical protein
MEERIGRGGGTFGQTTAACFAALKPDEKSSANVNGNKTHEIIRVRQGAFHNTCCFQLILTNGRSQP